MQAGWNASQPSGPNPTITVTQGDTITFNLSSGDVAHNFFIDLAGNGMPSCPPNVGCTGQFGPSTTATVTIPVNFAPGTYKYTCSIHIFSMRGNLVVQPPPDFALYSNPTSLRINQGSSNMSMITVNETGSFSNNLTLSAGVEPGGLTLHLNPLVVNLSSTIRTATAVLNITAPVGPTANGYTVLVTGNNGSLSRSTTITVTVGLGQGPITSPPYRFPFGFPVIVVTVIGLVTATVIFLDRRRRSHPQ